MMNPVSICGEIRVITPLSPVIKKSFDAWINRELWYTGHHSNEALFYVFVWNIYRYSRNNKPTEQDIRELILKRWQDKLEPEFLKNEALNYSRLYATLLAFAKARAGGR